MVALSGMSLSEVKFMPGLDGERVRKETYLHLLVNNGEE